MMPQKCSVSSDSTLSAIGLRDAITMFVATQCRALIRLVVHLLQHFPGNLSPYFQIKVHNK
eukprot:1392337-Rhodomonas_salina.1